MVIIQADDKPRATDLQVDPRLRNFAAGTVIPAQPLALTADLELDERRQRALSRYYLAAGAGGIAVGVHSTQFAIHDTHAHLLPRVLRLAAEEVAAYGTDETILIAGVVGPTQQAVAEAELASDLGYSAALVASYGAGDTTEEELIERSRAIGQILPVIGFYLQPSVGGRVLSREFWRDLAGLDSVIGIKVAPFDRYQTADVLWAVARSPRRNQIALYTGNDDHIVGDLLTSYPTPDGDTLTFVGGLLGQWSLWTAEAVRMLELSRRALAGDVASWAQLQALDVALTDANGALFDVRNNFRGCLPGIHEALRRQGLMEGLWCLDPHEQLSPGQIAEIDRVWGAYPHLRDDTFVQQHLADWLA